FWESMDEPTLKKFLDFRLSAGDLEESKIEYARYKNEILTISRFYAEASEFGQQVLKWKNAFKEMGTTVTSVGELCLMDFVDTCCSRKIDIQQLNDTIW
ncbi:8690_t:CDS:2, partial [Cetraspora pellucida]